MAGAWQGHEGCLDLLIKAGADVNTTSEVRTRAWGGIPWGSVCVYVYVYVCVWVCTRACAAGGGCLPVRDTEAPRNTILAPPWGFTQRACGDVRDGAHVRHAGNLLQRKHYYIHYYHVRYAHVGMI